MGCSQVGGVLYKGRTRGERKRDRRSVQQMSCGRRSRMDKRRDRRSCGDRKRIRGRVSRDEV